MPSMTQFLWNANPAIGASLTGFMTIHFDQSRTGAFCLVLEHRDESSPRRVPHVVCQSAFCQRLDVEGFNGDQVVIADQPRTCLMQVITALSPHGRVRARKGPASLMPAPGATSRSAELAMSKPEPSFAASSDSDAWNRCSVRKGREGCDAQVDANRPSARSDRAIGQGDREAHSPARSRPPKNTFLDVAASR